MTADSRSQAGRLLCIIQAALVIAFFGYYFVENFVLSESWETLPLRSIDDFAMHDSVRRMQEALLAGHFRKVMTFFDYGYGNIFWLANAIALLPLYFLDNAQLTIVAGRQLSLLFLFGSTILIGRVAQRLRPGQPSLHMSVMLLIAAAPMIAIIGTKFHVNAQCIFFGILAYHTLIKQDVLDHKTALKAASWAGVAVGLKLTAVFIVPILYATVWLRWKESGISDIGASVRRFTLRFGVVAAACTIPALLLFPFFLKDLRATYATFQMYKNMGSDFSAEVGLFDSIWETLSYTTHPGVIGVMAVLFVLLAWTDARKGTFTATALGLGVFAAHAMVWLTVHKPTLYQATYVLSASFFLPLGLLGLSDLRLPPIWKAFAGLSITLAGIGLSLGFREGALSYHRFFEIAQSARVTQQLRALDGMRAAMGPLPKVARVYQDSTTVFPATRFTKGIEVVYCYGNLRDYGQERMGRFDYVAVNSEDYIFKMLPTSAQYKNATDAERLKSDQEESARKRLRETGLLGNVKYKLIYEGHGAQLYQIADQ